MSTSIPCLQVGEMVMLVSSNQTVAKGKFFSCDPSRVCHTVEMGTNRVMVEIIQVFDETFILPDGEYLKDFIGSYLVWDRNNVREEPPSKNDLHEAVDEAIERECGVDEPEPEAFPRAVPQVGMLVKVFDEANVNFAVAVISFVTRGSSLGEIAIGDTHIGILITDFVDGATKEHLRYRNSLVPWPLKQLRASDGHMLEFPNMNTVPEEIDAWSRKRSYVNITRKSKVASLSV